MSFLSLAQSVAPAASFQIHQPIRWAYFGGWTSED